MFSLFFINRPKFAMVISIALMLAGLICIFRLPIAEYPEVAPPTIMVFTTYTGASAQDIADSVAAPLEAEVNGIEGLIYYSSTSDNTGAYTLTLTFSSDTDADMALVNVNNAVKRAERMLPTVVTMNGITAIKRTSDFLGIIAFTSDNPNHTPLYLSNYVSNNIKDSVTRIEGVGQALIFGEMKYSMRIWLDPVKMRYYDISQEEVQAAIAGQNVQAAAGSVGTEGASEFMQFKVETRGRLKEVSEFSEIIVRSEDEGRQVFLNDIARIELGSESYSGSGKVDGNPAVILAIFKLSDGNALSVIKGTQKLLNSLESGFPEGFSWTMPYDSTKFVRATMAEIVTTLLMTFSLVVLITYIFLQDWRATLVPAVAIPVSLLGTFLFMLLAGLSINTLTMFGLILVIGSVVDDAICVVESCMRLIHEEKLSPHDAAVRTMKELSGALVATTLVVVAVYTPIAFFGGMVGIIYRQFAITMCIALCLSTVVALTLSPALCALILRDSGEPKGPFKLFNRGLDFTRDRYAAIGGFLARRAVLTVLFLAAVLFGNYKLFTTLPSSFLPPEDKGSLLCEAVLPAGASLARSEAVLDEVTEIALGIEGVERVLSVPGRSMTSGDGENMGMIIINLKDWDQRTTPETTIEAVQAELLKRTTSISEARINAFVPPPIMGLGATGGVSFALQSTGEQTIQDLSEATNKLILKLIQSGKVMFASSSLNTNTPMISLDIDRARTKAMNVEVSSIFNTLQTQLGSMYVNDFNLYGKTYKVKVQSESEFRGSAESIGQLTVMSKTGDLVPLEALARINWTVGPRQVDRFNMFSAANVQTVALPGVSSGEIMELIKDIVHEELSVDYQVAWTDMSYQESQNEGQIIFIVALAMTFAYLFLVAQYESWTTPISVMLSVVTATFGGMAALFFTGHAMDIYCQLGLLMLVGLTAKTAILMVEFAKQKREEGLSIYDAAMAGMRVRFRAVMMTALSFVIGVFPMVIATGAGAGSRYSIGLTTFWGMFVASLIGIILIPGLYVITRTLSEGVKKLILGDPQPQETPSEVTV